MSHSPLSRRVVLGAGASGLLLPTLALSGRERGRKRAKNIIFCVSDGMSAAVPTMVDHLSLVNTGKPSYWAELMRAEDVVNGLQDTRSLNSLVTDSSAASSAWGSGRHIWNGQVNMYPDGTELRNLNSLFKEAGMVTGLVTTATITHATPAGFAVNCVQRDLEALIAEKYLSAKVDVLLGGGDKFFRAQDRKDKKDLYADFAAAGYGVVKDRNSLLAATGDRLLGIFASGHLPFTVDRNNSPELQKSTPTLAEMASVAIGKLNKKGKGFLLQIEGARIDHAAHQDDLAGLLYDQIAFEDAVKVAVDFARKDGNTLVVITSDHGNGNPGLNGAGLEYIDSTDGLKLANGMKSSYGPVFKELGSSATSDRVRDVVQAKLGIALTIDEAETVAHGINGKTPFAKSIFYGNPSATLAIMLGNHTKVTWTSMNHTSDHVFVTALGPGKEDFAGLTQNTSIFDLMLAQHGLKWSNPTETFEKARQDFEKLKISLDRSLFEMYASQDDDFGHICAPNESSFHA